MQNQQPPRFPDWLKMEEELNFERNADCKRDREKLIISVFTSVAIRLSHLVDHVDQVAN